MTIGVLLALIVFFTDILLILVLITLEGNRKSALIWIAVLAFMPLAGFILYLLFGQTFYRKKWFEVKGMPEDEIRELNDKVISLIDEGKKYVEDPLDKEYLDVAAAMMRANASYYIDDNDITIYLDGNDKFKDLFEDLRNAKSFIHLEYYIVRDDVLVNEMMDLLIKKLNEGVEVRLMIDAIGMNSGPKTRIKEFKKAGGEFSLFHSMPTVLFSPRKNNRNHRKIAVIDGKVGYVGGYNIGDEYLGKGPFGFWRDTGTRVVGNSVAVMNMRFFMDWKYATGKNIDVSAKYFPPCGNCGSDKMQLVSGGPDTKNNPIQKEYLKLVMLAKETIYIHTPYLVPDQTLKDTLELAALSGVDVKIIIPDRVDHAFVYWSSLYNAHLMMRNNVKVYQYHRGFVHSKTFVVDGKFCSIGSANLDERSLKLNFETNAMIYSERIGEQMKQAFLDDLQYCTLYTEEQYQSRTLKEKFKTCISTMMESLQ